MGFGAGTAKPCAMCCAASIDPAPPGRIEWVLLQTSKFQSGRFCRCVERGFEFRDHRRSVRLPGVLCSAHPIAREPACGQCARDQRRVGRRIVGAIVAITSRTFDMDATHVRGRHLQHFPRGP